MKNIALLTFHSSLNYGAVLQTYATCRILNELGGNVQLIDMRVDDGLRGASQLISIPAQWHFSRFKKKYYVPYTRRYRSWEELKSDPPQADLYLVGSDQVWNPEITKKQTRAFFLDFGPESIRRVAYASSFGTDHWYQHALQTEQIGRLLAKFDALSVRETSGMEICSRTFGLSATQVLDPTLLHQDYQEITGTLKPANTLVCFKFVQSDAFDRAALLIADRMNLQGIMLGRMLKTNTGFKSVRQPSIRKWIQTIAQSELVITDSFHGMAFSILYNKNFIVLPSYPGRSGRIKSLLSLLDLESRFCNSVAALSASDTYTTPIDYESVNRRLNLLREQSLEYIRSAIFLK